LRSHIENTKILPVSIWVEAILYKVIRNESVIWNFPKITSHKKAILFPYDVIGMTWDQRYCLWKKGKTHIIELFDAVASVSGYIMDSVFYGSIFIKNDIYYVDPLRVSMNMYVHCTPRVSMYGTCKLFTMGKYERVHCTPRVSL